MIPLWMFTLGSRFNDDMITVQVPILKILQSLAFVLVPTFIGIFMGEKFPKAAEKYKKIVTPIIVFTMLFIFTVGIYSNAYMFRLFRANTVVAACMLPYIGYILGGALALVACLPWKRIKTVAIETGIQNTMVAYLMLTFSLPAPDSDLAAVGSASSAMMTPLPLWIITIVYVCWNKWRARRSQKRRQPIDDKVNDVSSPLTDMSRVAKT